jgi:hypothetical protein
MAVQLAKVKVSCKPIGALLRQVYFNNTNPERKWFRRELAYEHIE